jgi:hypothetical protein
MTDTQRIDAVLTRMAALLRFGALFDWAHALEKFRGAIADDPVKTAAEILGTYGGAGSLNDLVLYRSGQLLVTENVEFDILRSELYELCHGIS